MRLPKVLIPLALAALLSGCNAASDRVEDPSTVTAPTTSATTSPSAGSGVQTIAVSYAGGKVTPGAFKPKVPLGAKVHLVVHADVSDEVHVHTYDKKAEISGGIATIDFTADIPGIFEVELEGKGVLLLNLQVG
jgi:hypothetical protein